MQDFLLVMLLLAVFAFGWFLMRKLFPILLLQTVFLALWNSISYNIPTCRSGRFMAARKIYWKKYPFTN